MKLHSVPFLFFFLFSPLFFLPFPLSFLLRNPWALSVGLPGPLCGPPGPEAPGPLTQSGLSYPSCAPDHLGKKLVDPRAYVQSLSTLGDMSLIDMTELAVD